MKVIIFGATGMVGQGALRESLLAADVDAQHHAGEYAARPARAAHPTCPPSGGDELLLLGLSEMLMRRAVAVVRQRHPLAGRPLARGRAALGLRAEHAMVSATARPSLVRSAS